MTTRLTVLTVLALVSGVLALTVGAAPAAAADDCPSALGFCPAAEGVEGSYADCTEALCEWDGEASVMRCTCRVRWDAPSVTAAECEPGTTKLVQSRYPGVGRMGVCTSSTADWGDCLGVPCTREADDTATCACRIASSASLASNQYVVVGGNPSYCAPGRYVSSATPGQVFAASQLLRCKLTGVEVLDPTITWVADR